MRACFTSCLGISFILSDLRGFTYCHQFHGNKAYSCTTCRRRAEQIGFLYFARHISVVYEGKDRKGITAAPLAKARSVL
jgi:hypothetical protein